MAIKDSSYYLSMFYNFEVSNAEDIERAIRSTLTALINDSKKEIDNNGYRTNLQLLGVINKCHDIWVSLSNKVNKEYPFIYINEYAFARYVLEACGDEICGIWRPARIAKRRKESNEHQGSPSRS